MDDTYTFLKLVDDYAIEIPKIQRDFAYGRDKEDIKKKRESLLSNLLNALIDKDDELNLYFIFGSVETNEDNKRLILLDGQQRVTILFLLHWYAVAQGGKEQMEEFRELLTSNDTTRFTYETRETSREFCERLVEEGIDELVGEEENETLTEVIEKLNKEQVSDVIEETPWFFLSWKKDPTVDAMLRTLDDIHEKYKELVNGENTENELDLYNRLRGDEKPVYFHFLELEEFGLTEDLYIKLNARGRPLTNLENFKAKFEQKLKKHCDEYDTNLEYKEAFSEPVDRDWMDFFWNWKIGKEDEEEELEPPDREMMNFFHALITNDYALNLMVDSSNSYEEEYLKKLVDGDSKPFFYYEDYNCFSSVGEKPFEDFVQRLTYTFNLLCGGEVEGYDADSGVVTSYLPDKKLLDEESLFEDAANDGLSLVQRVQLHALYGYLRRGIENGSSDNQEFKDWIRIIRNLSVNIMIDRGITIDQYKNSLLSVKEILAEEKSSFSVKEKLAEEWSRKNILKDIANKSRPEGFGFRKDQYKEEKIKAQLILRETDGDLWKKEITEVENHPYFEGQIKFLLDFSGVLDCYDENEKRMVDFNDEESKEKLKEFKKYKKIVSWLYDRGEGKEKGLRKLDEEEKYLFRRALLCKADDEENNGYLLKKGSNLCFVRNEGRDVSWKNFLGEEAKRGYLKKVLDDLLDEIEIDNLEEESVKEGLKKIIKADKENLNDWRKYLIECPECIDWCNKKFIRKNSQKDVLLLKKERKSGRHWKLFTYVLYRKLQDKNFDVEPKKGKKISEDKHPNRKYITGAETDIEYIEWVPGDDEYVVKIGDTQKSFLLSKSDNMECHNDKHQEIIKYLREEL